MGEFAVLSTKAPAVPVWILAPHASGEHCVSSFLDLGAPRPSYAEAARQAIASVPGADTLVDVHFYYHSEPRWLFPKDCAHVEGQAAAFR
jgi:hypothetical protein